MTAARSRRAPEPAPLPLGLRLVSALAALGGGAALVTLGALLRHLTAGHLLLDLPGAGFAALGSTVLPFVAGAWAGAAAARVAAVDTAAPRPSAVALAATAGAAGASLALSLVAAGTAPATLSRAIEGGAAALAALGLGYLAASFSAPPLAGRRRALPLLLPALASAVALLGAATTAHHLPTAAAPAARHAWALEQLGEPYRLAVERVTTDADLRSALGEPLAAAPAVDGPKRVLRGAGGWTATFTLEVRGPLGSATCELSGLRPHVGDRTVRWETPDCGDLPGSDELPSGERSPTPRPTPG
ncbi:MAG: hypothetical protein IPJ17_06870 [Holophagales bacterium]|nr:MAG: hypothetical protein IPJ17_06870 [Holophagales bacterium]